MNCILHASSTTPNKNCIKCELERAYRKIAVLENIASNGSETCARISDQRNELLAKNKKMESVLLHTLYQHQGAHSNIGQPIREIFGIGQFDDLTSDQLAIAKTVEMDKYPKPKVRV